MKRLLFLLFSFIFSGIVAYSQSTDPTPMQPFLISDLVDGFKIVLSYINWVFTIIFIVVSWLINDVTDAENKALWLAGFSKIPKVLRVIAFGLLLIVAFSWAFKYTGRMDYFKLFISLLFSMVAYKIGIDKVLKAISTRLFGFKL